MFHRILVPTDLTSASQRGLDMALALASPKGTQVTLLHVIEVIPNLEDHELRTFYDRLERDARSGLRNLVARAHLPGQVEIVQELVFNRMVERGLADADAGRVLTDEEMKRTIESWPD